MADATMIDLLLASSPQMQEVVLSGFSAPDLIRLSCATRAVRKVSIKMLKRRRLNLTIDTTYSEYLYVRYGQHFGDQNLDAKCSIVDVWGPTVSMDAPTMVDFVIDNKLIRFCQMIHTLIKHGIVRKLEFTGEPSYFVVVLPKFANCAKALPVGCLVFTIGMYQHWDGPEDHQMYLLKYITPHRLELKCSRLDEFIEDDVDVHPRDSCIGVFLRRGLSDAEDIELVDCADSSVSLACLLHFVTAPAINLGVKSALPEHVILDFILKWSCARRAVTLFCCCVKLTAGEEWESSPVLDGICSRFKDELDESSEIAWPATIPRTIVDHFSSAERHYGNGFLPSHAFVVGRAMDEVKLCVLIKEVLQDGKGGVAAVGVFRQ